MIQAPFTQEQVVALNALQHSNRVHPFTCPKCRDEKGVRMLLIDGKLVQEPDNFDVTRSEAKLVYLDRELVATTNGWICPTCEYTQDWAHEGMVEFGLDLVATSWENLL